MLVIKRLILMNKNVYLLLIFLFASFITNAQLNQNGDFEINNFKEKATLLKGWKCSPNDNLKFAKANYDDSNWLQLRTYEDFKKFMDDDFNEFAWFRLKLILPASLKNETFALEIYQLGALELYANGKKLQSLGNPSKNVNEENPVYTELTPFVYSFNSDTVVIAVKYSQHISGFTSPSIKFLIYLDKANNSISTALIQIRETYPFAILFGFLLALTIVHFLLFIYYKKQKENLYYSIFVFSLALITANELIIHSNTNFIFSVYSSIISVVYILSAFVFLQKLLYEIFKLKKKTLVFFYALVLVLMLLGLFVFNNFNLFIIIAFTVLIVDILRAITIGIIKKKYGFKYVATGTLIFIFGAFYYIVINNNSGFSSFLVAYLIISVFFLALPISMSIFLARQSSDTNNDLSKQLLNVKELSAKTLAQELDKKRILETQNIELERQVKERTEKVVQQKEKIEDINKHLTDSITYASRIQKAILGNADEITSKFKDAFILLKPHSIVSGDFYWFTELKNTELGDLQIIIAADCTGHGVPGAFMTVMGHDFLEEIVNKQNVLLPNEILQELDRRVTSNLKKQTSIEQVNDGMDISVLVYEKNNKKLHYAGANNPLYYVRNNELETKKATRNAIGGELYGRDEGKQKEFAIHTIDVLKNDKFYIFSDGFQDQFGGVKNRKYLTKNFKELLLKNSQLKMSTQKQIVEDELNKWKGRRNQTDDILIVGVEF